MKKQNIYMTKGKRIVPLSFILFFLAINVTIAQTSIDKGDLKLIDTKNIVSSARYFGNAQEDKPKDYILPKQASGYLYLRAEGADGGNVHFLDGSSKASGGEGASIMASFQIGTGSNMIPPGSTIRFLIGLHGENRKVSYTSLGHDGAGGGGGTGVLFKAPNQDDWTLLMVAGAGGGGCYAGGDQTGYSGKVGAITTSGSDGAITGGKGSDFKSAGGTDGLSGSPSKDDAVVGEPGGGIFDVEREEDCSGQSGWIGARTGTESDYTYDYSVEPIGGLGGNPMGFKLSNLSIGTGGGWGFGGGGTGFGNAGGGGGGGYSGGGGGNDKGGGGGGSYLSNIAVLSKKLQNGPTKSPGDGFIEYMITKTALLPDISDIRSISKTNKCISVEGDDLHDGDEMELENCDPNSHSQSWRLEGEEIKLVYSISKCINVDGASTSNGANIRIKNCNNTNAQKWIYDGVTTQLRSKLNLAKCLDSQLTSGSNVKLWDCSTTTHQKWDISSAATISEPTEVKYIVTVKYNSRAIQSISGAKWNSNVQIGKKSSSDNSIKWVFDGQQIKYGPSKDLCLGLENGSTAIGTNIQLMGSASTSDTRQWIYDGMSKQIRSAADPNKCMEVETGGSYQLGSNLKLMDCDDHLRQQFDIIQP